MTWIEWCERVLGPSWQTSIFGLLLIALAFLFFLAGGLLVYFKQLEIGGVVMAQGVGLVVAGAGLVKARSEAASNKVANELRDDIQTTKDQVVDVRQTAVPVAKQVAAQEAAAAVKQEVQEQVVPAAVQTAKQVVEQELNR